MVTDHADFHRFVEEFGDDVAVDILDRIGDLMWDKERSDQTISITGVHTYNSVNHTITGYVEHAGKTYAFEVDSGDRNGTVVRQWGDPETVPAFVPPKPTYWDFVPKDESMPITRPGMYMVYLAWRKEPWFEEKRRAYAYDNYFQPGSLVETHYRKWADTKGMRLIAREGAPVRPTGRTCVPYSPHITREYALEWQYFSDDPVIRHTFPWDADRKVWLIGEPKAPWSATDFADIGWYVPEIKG